MTDSTRFSNRLAKEKSPYLLQHAHNPVDWFPWGEEAFDKAAREDKPIFLSIGYSTCHWCHVMEVESFEDGQIAGLLNESFVPIKVDREERPDVDQIYMAAVVAMAGQGGWPLNLFLSPDLTPLWGGTYFPPRAKWGRPGFDDVLGEIAALWKNQRENLLQGGRTLSGYLDAAFKPPPGGDSPPGAGSLDAARDSHRRMFDTVHGGFGNAPKFPRPSAVGFLIREHARSGDADCLRMAQGTLDGMARGGIYDHLAGGFARYSTDDKWLVPHFEKMLYDNALLARSYIEAFQVTGEGEYVRVAMETLRYLDREMSEPGGGFHSAEDADSEGEEGKYYLWTPAEIREVLGEADARAWGALYGVGEKGNFEEKNILFIKSALGEELSHVGWSVDQWEAAREKLRVVRAQRIHPRRDDKVLTAWNALAISSFAVACQAFGEETYLRRAEACYAFLKQNLWRYGRLQTRWREGEAAVDAFVDDYAFLLAACLDLYETSFKPAYLDDANFLFGEMTRLFWDEESGDFFFTGFDQEKSNRLIVRPREGSDMALPSGNSVASGALLRLHALTGSPDAREKAERVLLRYAPALEKQGFAYSHMLQAVQFNLSTPVEVFVTGAEAVQVAREIQKPFHPNKVVCASLSGGLPLVPWSLNRPAVDGRTTIYVCREGACALPAFDAESALKQI